MAIDTIRILHRSHGDEQFDKRQALNRYQNEEWKDWPNDGAVSLNHNTDALFRLTAIEVRVSHDTDCNAVCRA